jgi:hypothetical protein
MAGTVVAAMRSRPRDGVPLPRCVEAMVGWEHDVCEVDR